MVISPSSPPGVISGNIHRNAGGGQKAIGGRSRTVLRPRNELRLDHNESRSWHGWHRHVSLVMLAFAMMAAIRHRANPPPPKKTTPNHGKHKSTATPSCDPLVNPGSPPHRHQTRSSGSNPHTSSHGHSGVELTKRSLSARTSKQKTTLSPTFPGWDESIVILGGIPSSLDL